MKGRAKAIVGAVVCVLMLSGMELSANLLVNPGFATQGAGGGADADGWTEASNSERQNWGSHEGDGFLMAVLGWNAPTTDQVYQDVPGGAGLTYSLDFWHEGDANWSGTALSASLIWLDSDGNPVGTPATVDLQSTLLEAWTLHTVSGESPNGTATVRVQFDATKPADALGAQKFDDLDLTAIPEPATLGFVGFGLIAVLVRLRRR